MQAITNNIPLFRLSRVLYFNNTKDIVWRWILILVTAKESEILKLLLFSSLWFMECKLKAEFLH